MIVLNIHLLIKARFIHTLSVKEKFSKKILDSDHKFESSHSKSYKFIAFTLTKRDSDSCALSCDGMKLINH